MSTHIRDDQAMRPIPELEEIKIVSTDDLRRTTEGGQLHAPDIRHPLWQQGALDNLREFQFRFKPSAFLIRCNRHLNLATGWYPKQLTRPANMLTALVPVLPATYGGLVDALAKRLVGAALPAAHVAAITTVAGKTPASALTSTDTSVAGSLPYLVALVLDSPSFQLR